MEIPILNLKAQYDKIQNEIEKVVLDVLRSGHYVLGPNVNAFEKEAAEFLGAKHAIGCANGSDALHVALRALDVGPGDEVITTAFTFVATAEAITQTGASPVFADIDLDTYNIDPLDIEKKITNKTKAIIVVHLYGQACDMDAIMALAKKHNLKVIEDTAQAFGTQYYKKGSLPGKLSDARLASPKEAELTNVSMMIPKDERNNADETLQVGFAGTIGDIGTHSFYPTKNLSCAGDGGMLTTNSDELAERLRRIRAHGSSRRYYHDEFGVNSRLDEVQAAILRIKLNYIQEWNEARAKIAAKYTEALKAAANAEFKIIPPAITNGTHIFHQYTIRIELASSKDLNEHAKLRDLIRDTLKASGIASEIYYPLPLHMQKLYLDLGHKEEGFYNSLLASKSILCLPIYPELSVEQVDYVCENLRKLATQKFTSLI